MFHAVFTMDDSMSPNSRGILYLKGPATIEYGTELKQALLDALDRVRELLIDVREVTEVDETCLQLLCAAHRSALGRHKSISLATEGTQVFAELTGAVGFYCSLPATCVKADGEHCLWFGPDRTCTGGRP
jgi:ABC-type transporter Mla MlaB component